MTVVITKTHKQNNLTYYDYTNNADLVHNGVYIKQTALPETISPLVTHLMFLLDRVVMSSIRVTKHNLQNLVS